MKATSRFKDISWNAGQSSSVNCVVISVAISAAVLVFAFLIARGVI